MIANRRRWGTISCKTPSRLPAISVDWIDSPVTLPFGRERFVMSPVPIGSTEIGKTIGMAVVTRCTIGIAPETVTMTSVFRRTNSAAISETRSGRPSDQRYCIAIF